eukprot:15347701-Ditylum_brightwellii.AAC.1
MKSAWQPDTTFIPTYINSPDCLMTLTTRQYQSILANPTSNPATFEDYINTCNEWETQLFRGLVLHKSAHKIIHLCQHTSDSLIIGSDGSVEKSMTFGWKMGTNMEAILVKCSGPTYGTALSFCAEM